MAIASFLGSIHSSMKLLGQLGPVGGVSAELFAGQILTVHIDSPKHCWKQTRLAWRFILRSLCRQAPPQPIPGGTTEAQEEGAMTGFRELTFVGGGDLVTESPYPGSVVSQAEIS
jgi:hypothetical protein